MHHVSLPPSGQTGSVCWPKILQWSSIVWTKSFTRAGWVSVSNGFSARERVPTKTLGVIIITCGLDEHFHPAAKLPIHIAQQCRGDKRVIEGGVKSLLKIVVRRFQPQRRSRLSPIDCAQRWQRHQNSNQEFQPADFSRAPSTLTVDKPTRTKICSPGRVLKSKCPLFPCRSFVCQPYSLSACATPDESKGRENSITK